MDIDYTYTKLRGSFGKQCLYSNEGPKLIEDLKSEKQLMEKYIYKNPLNKGVQVSRIISQNEANTVIKEFSDRGMNHIEGGWPKDLDTNDDEAVLRFRKKVERQDNYIAAMKHITEPMEHAILQNNAINIYERYYAEALPVLPTERETCRIQSMFKDPNTLTRPITHCSWSPEKDEFSVSHCNTQFQRVLDKSFESYIWDAESPNRPIVTFSADTPILCLEYNPRDGHLLAAGMFSGQVAHFDSRKGPGPIDITPFETSHREPTHSLLWISSKSGMEFFSTSTDGTVKWWDCRKLDRPTDSIILDLARGDKPNITRANPASCLEYEQTIPVRYMVGTETGYVIGGNRKGTTHQEKLPGYIKCHMGPIYSIHRNQAFTKNFLTVGDWSARIWSEDCKESAIIWTKYHGTRLTAGEWSGGRLSAFFLTREDGILDLWDILTDQKHAVLSLKLCYEPLTSLRVRENGELVLAANSSGTTFLVRYPSDLTESFKNEKLFLAAMFDREGRREKLLETRNKEIKLKLREQVLAKEAAEGAEESEARPKTEFEIQVQNYKEALERDYLNEIETVLRENEKRREAINPEGQR